MSGPAADSDLTADSGLVADLRVTRGALNLDVTLDVAPGAVVALLGPNGAGKSTALRVLAGLTPLDAGRVALDGATLDDPADGTFTPPAQRAVGMVFQDYLLFAHLSALDNVAFGLRAGGRSRRAARAEAGRWLDRVGLAEHAGDRPATLSGGQAQRVALARALAPEPRLLLLDEPLAALDAGTRASVRSDLLAHLRAFPGCGVLVTHDLVDAMVLADQVVVVESGRVVQRGRPRDLARTPRTEYVARLVGLNLLRGEARGRQAQTPLGAVALGDAPGDGPVLLAFPASGVLLTSTPPGGGPPPEGGLAEPLPARVSGVEQHGDTVRIALDVPGTVVADVPTTTAADLALAPGAPVWVTIPPSAVHAYPA